jgi:VanZ family protein
VLFFNDEIKLGRVVQGLFFAALFVVTAATVMPAPSMPVEVTWNDKILHFIAYFGLGILGGTGWPERRTSLLIMMPLFGMALECVQGGLIPGRAFDWYDGVANALGAFAGVASSLIARRVVFTAT